MPDSLAELFRAALAGRPGPWGPALLRGPASSLPPVPRAGFEVPLRGADPVGLQQCFRLDRGDPAPVPVPPGTSEVWLEFDDARDPAAPASTFLRFAGDRTPPDLALPPPAQRCLEALPPGASCTHVGFMAGRPLRLVLADLPPETWEPYLRAVGWPGDPARAAARSDELFGVADRVRLCLDAEEERVGPRLGMELFVGPPERFDPRWSLALELLVAEGLCTPERRDLLLGWPGRSSPLDVPDWPASLLVRSLLDGGGRPCVLEARLSHVKVDLEPARAKGYVGLVHVPLEPLGPPVAPPPRPATSREEACSRALGFLLGARTQAGGWLDFPGFAEGPADEWPTAFVASVLAALPEPEARRAAARAWDLLARRRRDGWGWNGTQPPDADSTTWVLRLGQALGHQDSEAFRRGLAFLRRHLDGREGLATYRVGAHERPVHASWLEAHGCVTAAAAGLDALRGDLRPDGSGFWWVDGAYAAALAAEAGFPVPEPPAAPWTPFGAALRARQAAASGKPPDLGRLLESQLEDGSWSASAELAFPNREGLPQRPLDRARVFTTATVLAALAGPAACGSRAGRPPAAPPP